MKKELTLASDMELRIKDVAQELDMKMVDIATKANITKSYLSRINSGRISPSFEMLEKIAKAMDVPVHRLIKCPEGYEHFEIKDVWHGIRKL